MGILISFIFIYRLKLKVKRLRMALTLDERVEIVLLSGHQGRTQRQVADEFNARHPKRNPITHSAAGKLVKKFKKTGPVVDKPRVGRPSAGEDIQTGVTDKFHAHSHWFQTFRTPCSIILAYMICRYPKSSLIQNSTSLASLIGAKSFVSPYMLTIATYSQASILNAEWIHAFFCGV
jgi:hypothetical protein